MKHADRLVRLAFCLTLAMACVLSSACGKEGPPVPRDHRQMFTWGETEADFAGDCLVFTGQIEGAYENASLFVLELEAATEEICLDCPFKPGEVSELSPVSEQDVLFAFQYCPTNRADAYRWRLVAHNVFPSLPHSLSPVKLVRRPF